MQSELTFWLPNDSDGRLEVYTSSNSVVFIGANGAGKSRLGAWIEDQSPALVHRIGAQRSLTFDDNISLKSYQESEDMVLYGDATQENKASKYAKYGFARKSAPTHFFNDYSFVLSALIAKTNDENTAFVDACKEAEEEGRRHPHTPCTAIDKLKTIWKDIFPHRELHYGDLHFKAADPQGDQTSQYPATSMSDGEKTALYFIAQVLCVPDNRIILIDEPELHLHKSLMNRLWLALERDRPDCLFIYITHDTQFAAQHSNADKYWVKSYSGNNQWQIEKIEESNLPEDLLFDLLGNRKSVLFVEGERGSFDTQLYSLLYEDYYVVPCGGCGQVIAKTKAFNGTPSLHHCKAYGIIDRDFRTDYEIEQLKKDNVFALAVAEVENLLIVEEVVTAIAESHGLDGAETFEAVKNYVIKERFERQYESQVCQAVVSEIEFRLGTISIDKKDESKAKEALNQGLDAISFEEIKSEVEERFSKAKSSGDYRQIIRLFNEKTLAKSIGHYLSMLDKDYCKVVIGMCRNGLLDAGLLLDDYLPSRDDIPR